MKEKSIIRTRLPEEDGSMKKLLKNHSVVLLFMGIFLLCFAIGLYIWLRLDLRGKEKQLADLQAQLAEVQMDNEGVNYLINDADTDELYERLARDRGYVYPDEKVYYDVTPGK